MKFEIIREKKVVMWTEQKSCIPPIDELRVMSKARIPYKFKLNGKYIIYTKNEKDKEGNTIIYSGKIVTIDNKKFIENIPEGEEWEKLKNIMKAMSKHSLEGEKNEQ